MGNNIGEYVEISDIQSKIDSLKSYYNLYPNAKNNDLQRSLEFNINIFESKLNIFEEIHVFWSLSKKGVRDNAIAEYVHSSSLNSHPLIILYEDTIQSEIEYSNNIDYLTDSTDHIIGSTLFHELAHAIVDIDNCYIFDKDYNILQFQDEEEYVEEFCRQFYDNRYVSNDIKKLSNLFKSRSWIGIDPDYEINY